MLRMTKKRKFDGQICSFYFFWYGLGRVWIEAMRTDSLYLFGTGIRVSQLVAGLCVLVFGAVLIRNLFVRRPEPAQSDGSCGASDTEN